MSIALSDALARDAAVIDRGSGGRGTAGTFNIGETAELTVLERVQDRLYRVLLNDSPRSVESTAELAPGSRLIVQVTASGERLVLRSADLRVVSVSLQEVLPDRNVDNVLAKLVRRHRVRLDREQTTLIEHAMRRVEEPVAMAAAGVFLGKLGLPFDAVALQALYEAQVWSKRTPPAAVAHLEMLTNAEQLSTAILQHFAKDERIEAPLAPPASQSNAAPVADSTAEHDEAAAQQSRRVLAQQLLNVSNEGSLHHQYGSLPLLIADQLVELDVLCFHSAAATLPSGLRRLTMTFNSKTLGPIEVNARALGESLVLTIRAASAAPSEVLSAHADDVRGLVERLGWRIESLSYDHAQLPRAASYLMQHLSSVDTLDRLL